MHIKQDRDSGIALEQPLLVNINIFLNSRQKFENILGHEYKEPGDVV
jgi:hypothetical protein